MKILIRKTPDNYSPSLSPLNKIALSIRSRYSESEFYRRRQEMREEQESISRVQREDELKTLILTKIHIAITDNHYFKDSGKVTESILIPVPRNLSEELYEILKHKEFLGYNIELTHTVKDAQHLFETFPIFVKISSKVGVG